MRKKLDPIWRLTVALALVFALVPLLATPVAADIANTTQGDPDVTTFTPQIVGPGATDSYTIIITDSGNVVAYDVDVPLVGGNAAFVVSAPSVSTGDVALENIDGNGNPTRIAVTAGTAFTSTLTFTGNSPITEGAYDWSVDITDSASGVDTATLTSYVDATNPITASVTTPVDGGLYDTLTPMPTEFSGAAADNTDGSGLDADSTTFTLQRGDDSKYWDGDSWEDGSTDLATTHSATTSDTPATWTDAITLPTWADDDYTVQAKATDKAGNTFTGTAITFTYESTDPTTASVTTPADGADYNAASMPSEFSGQAADNTNGLGLDADSTTFTLQRADTNYWTGSAWQAGIAWLATTHSATASDTPATWTDAITLPTWADGDYTVQAKATDKAGNTFTGTAITFTYDNTAPVVTIVTMSGDPLDAITDDPTPTFTGTSTDAAPSSGMSTNTEYRVDGGSWTSTGAITPWDFTTGSLPSGPHTVDVRVTDDCGNTSTASHAFVVDLVPGPPVLLDAVTGWAWDWENDEPWNANSRTTIMLVYSEPLDPLTVTTADYTVGGYPPMGREVHMYTYPGGGHTFGLVFLTVPTMLTDATPTVIQVLPVSDYAGYHLDTAEVLCQDGIAPLITVTASPEEPGYNDLVTVTATASEQMSEAYIYIVVDADDPANWPSKPTDPWTGTEPEEWVAEGWKVMEPGATNVWTYSFLYAYGPEDMVAVEVAGHDLSAYHELWEDDLSCFWKHEKWYQESLYFTVLEKLDITLVEGWNLISVPRPLIDPSLPAVFDGTGVTHVYYYTGGQYGSWHYASYDNLYGRWYNPYRMTIDPGKGYFVYCSPPSSTVTVWLSWFGMTPPAYPLVAGWNLAGFTSLDWPVPAPMDLDEYLSSLTGVWQILYLLDPTGFMRVLPETEEKIAPGEGLWLFLSAPGTHAP